MLLEKLEKDCNRCKRILSLDSFHIGTGRLGRQSHCKDCQNETRRLKRQSRLEQKRIENLVKWDALTKKCSVCKEILPRSGFYKSSKERSGLESMCKKCSGIQKKQRYEKRKQQQIHLTVKIDCKQCTKCKQVLTIANFRPHPLNPDGFASWCKKCKNADGRRYIKENKPKMAYWVRKRYAFKLKATPLWADEKKIREIYKKAANLTKETGIEHHVDHIIPLSNPLVCGLHVESNLQILTAEENLRKSNKFTPYVESDLV